MESREDHEKYSTAQITSPSSSSVLYSEHVGYATGGIYSITLKDIHSETENVLQVAAISHESAKLKALEVASSKFNINNPEIVRIVKAY